MSIGELEVFVSFGHSGVFLEWFMPLTHSSQGVHSSTYAELDGGAGIALYSAEA